MKVALKSFGTVVNTIRNVCIASSKGYLNRLDKYLDTEYTFMDFGFEFVSNDDTTITMKFWGANDYVHKLLLDGHQKLVMIPVSPIYGSSLDEFFQIVDSKAGVLLIVDQFGRIKDYAR